ncbi:hypothetical protein [Selenomonas sp. oral taxon 137]|uniref:hypothetical protein n=1 Tax=Selenomonas sp. oral taxon 137 TaxID=712531 RepID=UPI001C2FE10D|nr:hypothetical protein [Selenomonas sp. oral taxon 137]
MGKKRGLKIAAANAAAGMYHYLVRSAAQSFGLQSGALTHPLINGQRAAPPYG